MHSQCASFPKKHKKKEKASPEIEAFSPFPSAFHLVSGIGGAHISRLVLTRSEVGVATRQDQCGEARAAVVSPLLLYFGEPVPPLATVSQVIIGRENVPRLPKRYCPAPHQTAHSWWLSPIRTCVGVFSSEDDFIIPRFLFRVGKSCEWFRYKIKSFGCTCTLIPVSVSDCRHQVVVVLDA